MKSGLVKPAIKIFVDEKINSSKYMDVLLGIEEEGIPFEISKITINDIYRESYLAANDSNLEVGIGIDSDSICLHYTKLKKKNPLFIIDIDSTDLQKRTIGANSARLVKRMPFKI